MTAPCEWHSGADRYVGTVPAAIASYGFPAATQRELVAQWRAGPSTRPGAWFIDGRIARTAGGGNPTRPRSRRAVHRRIAAMSTAGAKEPVFVLRVMWGHINTRSNTWHANSRLPMSHDQQLAENVRNGYLTSDGKPVAGSGMRTGKVGR